MCRNQASIRMEKIMTIQDIKASETRAGIKLRRQRDFNAFALSRAAVTLSNKLVELGVTELKWHDTVASYCEAVANSNKRIVGEYFREDLNTLPPSRFFGITGHDDSGRTICTTANRYDDVAGWDLREYIRHFWYRNYHAEGGGHARLAPESVAFADGIEGPFAYIGDTSVDPAFSGSDVAAYLVRLCVLGCYLEWRPAYIYGWMARHHAAKGLAFRWGFPIVWPGGFIWDVPPENKAYLDLCFGLCPAQGVALIAEAPLEIGVTARPKSNKE